MTYGESNGDETDDVKWPWKIKVNTLRAQYLGKQLEILFSNHR